MPVIHRPSVSENHTQPAPTGGAEKSTLSDTSASTEQSDFALEGAQEIVASRISKLLGVPEANCDLRTIKHLGSEIGLLLKARGLEVKENTINLYIEAADQIPNPKQVLSSSPAEQAQYAAGFLEHIRYIIPRLDSAALAVNFEETVSILGTIGNNCIQFHRVAFGLCKSMMASIKPNDVLPLGFSRDDLHSVFAKIQDLRRSPEQTCNILTDIFASFSGTLNVNQFRSVLKLCAQVLAEDKCGLNKLLSLAHQHKGFDEFNLAATKTLSDREISVLDLSRAGELNLSESVFGMVANSHMASVESLTQLEDYLLDPGLLEKFRQANSDGRKFSSVDELTSFLAVPATIPFPAVPRQIAA